MCDVVAPEGPLCAGQLYEFTTANCAGAFTVNWTVIDAPPGVSEDEIFFGSPQNNTTLIAVPVGGDYSFAVESCSPA